MRVAAAHGPLLKSDATVDRTRECAGRPELGGHERSHGRHQANAGHVGNGRAASEKTPACDRGSAGGESDSRRIRDGRSVRSGHQGHPARSEAGPVRWSPRPSARGEGSARLGRGLVVMGRRGSQGQPVSRREYRGHQGESVSSCRQDRARSRKESSALSAIRRRRRPAEARAQRRPPASGQRSWQVVVDQLRTSRGFRGSCGGSLTRQVARDDCVIGGPNRPRRCDAGRGERCRGRSERPA